MSDKSVDQSKELANGRLEIVTTVFLKHGKLLLDPSLPKDQAVIARLLASPRMVEDLIRGNQGRAVVVLVSRLPRGLQSAVLPDSAMVELVEHGCGVAILGLVEKWDVTDQRRFLAAPELRRSPKVSTRACGPRNLMKMDQRRHNGKGSERRG